MVIGVGGSRGEIIHGIDFVGSGDGGSGVGVVDCGCRTTLLELLFVCTSVVV